MILTLSVGELRAIVREEIKALLPNGNGAGRDWLRASELAELYSLPKSLFEEHGRAGDIERTKPGRNVLFNRRSVEAFLAKRRGS